MKNIKYSKVDDHHNHFKDRKNFFISAFSGLIVGIISVFMNFIESIIDGNKTKFYCNLILMILLLILIWKSKKEYFKSKNALEKIKLSVLKSSK